MTTIEVPADASFRDDIGSLEVSADGLPRCVVHGGALRRWTGGRRDAAACLAFFLENRTAVIAAARAKAERSAATTAFHLTSRDIAAALDQHRICTGRVQT